MALAFGSTTPEKLVAGPDGVMEPLTTGSTRLVALTVMHAGKVKRYAFSMF
jgi:hypothetical protein